MKGQIVLYIVLVSALTGFGYASDQQATDLPGKGKEGLRQTQDGLICQEMRSGKMWQVQKKGEFSSLPEAEHYAADLQLGGYDDWRLPTKEELFNLSCMFFWKRNNDCLMNRKGEYWTVSQKHEASLGHWEIDFACGPEYHYIKAIQPKGFVRAVRP